MKEIYIQHIAGLLDLKDWQVENCAELFADGDTIPFISRYRKEKTGGMDDADVAEFDKAFPYKKKLKLPGQIFRTEGE